MSQEEFAKRPGISWPRANQLLNKKRSVTPDTALRLERLFGVQAQTWLNMQLAWDLYHAQRSPAAKEIKRLQPIDVHSMAHA